MKLLIMFFLSFSLFANDFGATKIEIPNLNKGDFDIGVEKFNKGEYEDAGNLFINLFVTGDRRPIYYLGKMFGEGLGVDKDCKKALFFTFTSIKEGFCEGDKLLSDWLIIGNCTKIDKIKSKKYLDIYNRCLIK